MVPAVILHPDCDWLSVSSLQKFDQLDVNAHKRDHPFVIVLYGNFSPQTFHVIYINDINDIRPYNSLN